MPKRVSKDGSEIQSAVNTSLNVSSVSSLNLSSGPVITLSPPAFLAFVCALGNQKNQQSNPLKFFCNTLKFIKHVLKACNSATSCVVVHDFISKSIQQVTQNPCVVRVTKYENVHPLLSEGGNLRKFSVIFQEAGHDTQIQKQSEGMEYWSPQRDTNGILAQ